MTKLLHADLTYTLRGVLFDVYNILGPGLREEYYQRAIPYALQEKGIACEPEKPSQVYYEAEPVGHYYVDFWLENGKVLLETKVAPTIEPLHKAQIISYLKVTGVELGILANFGGPSMQIERVPNYVTGQAAEFHWQPQPAPPGLLYPELFNTVQMALHKIHFTLGPGFIHQIYRRAARVELRKQEVHLEYIKHLPIEYHGHILGQHDARVILIENQILLAVYAYQHSEEMYLQQLKTHLCKLNLKLGLLANFHGTRLKIIPVRIK
jgi:GxxExxY protein